MKRDAGAIQKYWNDRAKEDSSAQSTTMDVWLRDIESRVVCEALANYQPLSVIDVGCGDGRTTIKCAEKFPTIQFNGVDYAETMIRNAYANVNSGFNNVNFHVGDILNGLELSADFLFTTRCLINLESWEAQQTALDNICKSVISGGYFLMIENFQESHDSFNSVRSMFGLSHIPVRDHNLFFKTDALLEKLVKYFDTISFVNISSQYYLVSRVIYSKICADNGEIPDYNDAHHELASLLPFLGDFGPTKALLMRKK